jgi:hypothetical protein
LKRLGKRDEVKKVPLAVRANDDQRQPESLNPVLCLQYKETFP